MALRKLYIQQLTYDGSTYTKGEMICTEDYNIGLNDMPFKYLPQYKDYTKRDWQGEDGVDVYIPTKRKLKEYSTEITFVYNGENSVKKSLKEFIEFFRCKQSDGTYKEARFAMWDDFTKIGRKDIVCNTDFNDVDVYYIDDDDDNEMAKFKLKFDVCDPATDVTPDSVTKPTTLNW